jgi:HEAT repeat protein
LGALNRIHPNPELAIPAFMAALDDPDQSLTRELAANALGSYGPQAKAAVPILLRTLATNAAAGAALKKIDPETAADAGIR